MGSGEFRGVIEPVLDLLMHRFMLLGLAGMGELGVDQDRAHGIEQLRLLDGQGA